MMLAHWDSSHTCASLPLCLLRGMDEMLSEVPLTSNTLWQIYS